MRLWCLSHRQPGKAQASLHIRAVSPESSLFAQMKYGSRQRVRPKIRHVAPQDGCACRFDHCLSFYFEEWVYGERKVPYLMRWFKLTWTRNPSITLHRIFSRSFTVPATKQWAWFVTVTWPCAHSHTTWNRTWWPFSPVGPATMHCRIRKLVI